MLSSEFCTTSDHFKVAHVQKHVLPLYHLTVCSSPQGIDCFDYSKDLNVIATGGLDHVVRLWNPYVTAKPVAILRGHISRVLDVIIEEQKGTVFSYDCDTVSKKHTRLNENKLPWISHDSEIEIFNFLFIVLKIQLFSMPSSHYSEIEIFNCLFIVSLYAKVLFSKHAYFKTNNLVLF
jgi:WD40 repeat protein